MTQKHCATVPLGERRRSRTPGLSGSSLPDGPRVRSVSPRDLFPAAHTRKPNAKSVPAQLPPPGRPPSPRRACARPHARSGVRRRPGVASRWETRARRAARGVGASFPSLPPLPSPLPSPLPKNVPLRGEWLRPEVTPPSPARPFFSPLLARRAGLVRLRRGQGADGWEPRFGRRARVRPAAHPAGWGRDWREPAAGLRRGEPVKCGNLTLGLRLRSRSCLGDLHGSYPLVFPEAESPGNAPRKRFPPRTRNPFTRITHSPVHAGSRQVEGQGLAPLG